MHQNERGTGPEDSKHEAYSSFDCRKSSFLNPTVNARFEHDSLLGKSNFLT